MSALTSAERIGQAASGQEPDRVPFFLPVTMHGARAVGVPLRDYFGRPDDVVEGQLRLRRRLGHDAVTSFLHASLEVEAFGGESHHYDDGPPNAGAPPLTAAGIAGLEPPRIEDHAGLRRTIEITGRLAERVAGECPVMAGLISPFSLPAMQLGLPAWFELLHEQPALAERLLRINEAFTLALADALVAAGAGIISFSDPVASPDLVPDSIYRALAHPSLLRCLKGFKAPTVISFASARGLARVPDAIEAGALGIGGSALEPIGALKAACGGRLVAVGGLDSIALAAASPAEAAATAHRALAAAGRGGRFVLSEHHGEIPWQVPEEVLDAVAAAVHEHGRYPLRPEESLGA